MPGPRNRFDRPTATVPSYDDSRERDRLLEERWSYERDGTMSTLAYVSAYRKELTAEFMAWYSGGGQIEGESKEQAVALWERVRFGTALDKAGHGVLCFVILDAFFPARHGKKWEKKPDSGKPVPADHSMPRLSMGRKEIDARLQTLAKQAQEIAE